MDGGSERQDDLDQSPSTGDEEETDDGLDPNEEALRQAIEDMPDEAEADLDEEDDEDEGVEDEGLDEEDEDAEPEEEDVPVFDRGSQR